MGSQYQVWNGAMQTTSVYTATATGTAAKTLLQIQANASWGFAVRAWGISFDATAVATPVRCELIETGTVGATVTAHVASGVQPYGALALAIGGTSGVQLGVNGTGYNASAEGAITATRLADAQAIPPTSGYSYEWSLGNEFLVPAGRILRVRVQAAVTVNAVCWVRYEE